MEAGFVPGTSPLGEDCPGWAVAVGWQAFVAPGTPASSCLNENKNVANIHRGERSQEITFDFISAEAGIRKRAQLLARLCVERDPAGRALLGHVVEQVHRRHLVEPVVVDESAHGLLARQRVDFAHEAAERAAQLAGSLADPTLDLAVENWRGLDCALDGLTQGLNLIADQVATNYRKADLTSRERVMLDFAVKVATDSAAVEGGDFDRLRDEGFTDDDIWDIGSIAALFAYSNRMANFASMMPNEEFYGMERSAAPRDE